MMISKQRFIALLMILFFLVLVGYLILGSSIHVQSNTAVILTFSVNIAFFLIQLVREVKAHPYSFGFMFWLFSLFFFGFAPLLQHLTNTYSWNLQPMTGEVVQTNLYVLLWSLVFWLGRKGKIRFLLFSRRLRDVQYAYAIKKRALNALLLVAVLISVYYFVEVGFTNLFIRSTNRNADLNTMMGLLTEHVFRSTMLMSAAFFIIWMKQHRRISGKAVLVITLFLIICFPTGLARNTMAAYYAGLMIITFDKTARGRWFTVTIIIGLVLVFPAITIFRYAGALEGGGWGAIMEGSVRGTYLGGDYDTHQMFISVQRYVNQFGFSLGQQLFGALLFFVPRSIWPAKPIGTGHTVMQGLNQYYFTNVSAPLVSEAFINFGILGIILFGFILGMVTKHVDNRYWASTNRLQRIRIIYPFSMFQFFFLLRGDMMSAGAYLTALYVVGSVIYRFAVARRTV